MGTVVYSVLVRTSFDNIDIDNDRGDGLDAKPRGRHLFIAQQVLAARNRSPIVVRPN